MTNWWASDDSERFWLEVTDREDLGADLRAPTLDDSGRPNWRYGLFQHASVGDVVLHYQKRHAPPAIVGFSRIAGPAQSAEIVWAARGTYARSKGTTPHARPGYRIPLEGFTAFHSPLTLQDIREHRADLVAIVAELELAHKQPLYFPFELSETREVRLLQGYAFKLPRQFVTSFVGLSDAVSTAERTRRGGPVADLDEQAVSKNPPWTRDELILALELYLAGGASPPSKTTVEVLALSNLLGKMGRALGLTEAATYRNANGVYMKMMNFRRFDPAYTTDGKVGLARGNKDEEFVWKEFAGDKVRLSKVAAAIRIAVERHVDDAQLQGVEEPEIEEAEEGRVLTRLHRVRERNRKLVAACKATALKRFGRLECAACTFDFAKTYGQSGKGLIEVHHTKPVHTLAEGDKTNINDLALLCANCHRVVHSSRRWLSVEEVRALVAANAGAASA